MTTSLLAYIPSPAQGVWHLGPVPIRAYALCIITGIIAALIIGDRRWVARGGEPGVIYDIALWAVPFGLIGGRLYHLMTDWRTYFAEGGAGIAGAVRIWDGGLGIWGAVALGGVGAWIGCRRHGIPLPAFGDAVAPGIILAQAIGRLGNYFNQELYGRPTDLPWGLQIFQRSDGSGVVNPHLLNGVSTGQVYEVVHPTFLYELLWNLLVFFILLWADRRFKLGHGRLFALYVAAYCVGRFGVELMRSDTATLIAGIRVNSFTSTFVFIGAVVYMMVAPRGREDPSTLAGRRTDDGVDVIELDSGAVLKVPAAVAAGAGAAAAGAGAAAGDDDDEEPAADSDVADEADAAETQSDETEALAEVSDEDEDAVDAEDAVEDSADESVEETVDSDDVEAEDESDTEAEDLAGDEAEVAAAEPDAEDVDATEAAEESEGATESDESAAEAAEETAVADADDSADVEDAEAEAAEESEDEAAEEADEATESGDSADDIADDEEADAEPVEDAAPKVEAAEKVEPVGVPVWEPPAARRRWWRRQG
ncbi:diacylglyceryl transferase [Mycobacterium sp. ST-F2]|uniref:prolipoprotein diacylglyceryl transferase n=1 Tax=Mycobacterium sp. ST-F2 TaxID=1490484 RepID=UPI00093EB769|nr:prolipoprotein diacylglyceryl transferase [Mycobacterium sp. ST-F2]OKH85455.1 diacylglyceryl transferase [Mycobacterium sp. ST-F2]